MSSNTKKKFTTIKRAEKRPTGWELFIFDSTWVIFSKRKNKQCVVESQQAENSTICTNSVLKLAKSIFTIVEFAKFFKYICIYRLQRNDSRHSKSAQKFPGKNRTRAVNAGEAVSGSVDKRNQLAERGEKSEWSDFRGGEIVVD